MPEFFYKKKIYYNPVEFVMDRIGGAWKMPILWRLKSKVMRYNELKKDIPHITEKMLTTKLKALHDDGFIEKKIYASVPPKVEYKLTERGKEAIEVIDYLRKYGFKLMKEFNIPGK